MEIFQIIDYPTILIFLKFNRIMLNLYIKYVG